MLGPGLVCAQPSLTPAPAPSPPQYMVDQFSLDLNTAGDIGALFGFMNLFTRASGGMISDIAARYYGMRGRCVGARGAGWWAFVHACLCSRLAGGPARTLADRRACTAAQDLGAVGHPDPGRRLLRPHGQG